MAATTLLTGIKLTGNSVAGWDRSTMPRWREMSCDEIQPDAFQFLYSKTGTPLIQGCYTLWKPAWHRTHRRRCFQTSRVLGLMPRDSGWLRSMGVTNRTPGGDPDGAVSDGVVENSAVMDLVDDPTAVPVHHWREGHIQSDITEEIDMTARTGLRKSSRRAGKWYAWRGKTVPRSTKRNLQLREVNKVADTHLFPTPAETPIALHGLIIPLIIPRMLSCRNCHVLACSLPTSLRKRCTL